MSTFTVSILAASLVSTAALTGHRNTAASWPTFHMDKQWSPSWPDKYGDKAFRAALWAHPNRVNDAEKANLLFIPSICKGKDCSKAERIQELLQLPVLPRDRAYVLGAWYFSLDRCENPDVPVDEDDKGGALTSEQCEDARKMIARPDLLFLEWDRRNHLLINDVATPLSGVTLAPPAFLHTEPDLTAYKLLLSFWDIPQEGWHGSSQARPNLCTAWEQRGKRDDDPPVFMSCNASLELEKEKELLKESAFVLIPHGDGRWRARFSAAVGACAVPVVMADGLGLPYDQLIDWKDAYIRVNENLAENPDQLLASLPRDDVKIQEMRRKVCGINREYLGTEAARANALIQSLGRLVSVNRDPEVDVQQFQKDIDGLKEQIGNIDVVTKEVESLEARMTALESKKGA